MLEFVWACKTRSHKHMLYIQSIWSDFG